MRTITVPKPRWYAWWLDEYLVPIMYLLSGTFSESPQETHPWNRYSLTREDVQHLSMSHMVFCEKVSTSQRWRFGLPMFHMPIVGGWRRYVVLAPRKTAIPDWYVGWIADDVIGVSQLPLSGPVRLLQGGVRAHFFGLDGEGKQISLECVGSGRIGDGGPFSQVPLR